MSSPKDTLVFLAHRSHRERIATMSNKNDRSSSSRITHSLSTFLSHASHLQIVLNNSVEQLPGSGINLILKETDMNRTVFWARLDSAGHCILSNEVNDTIGMISRSKLYVKRIFEPEVVAEVFAPAVFYTSSPKGREKSRLCTVEESEEGIDTYVWKLKGLCSAKKTVVISQSVKEFLCLRIFVAKFYIDLHWERGERKIGRLELHNSLLDNDQLTSPLTVATISFTDETLASVDKYEVCQGILACLLGRIMCGVKFAKEEEEEQGSSSRTSILL